VLYSGGRGSGKSQILAYAAFREACKPHNEVLLVRKCLVDLKASTMVSLLGGPNPVIPQEYIENHNRAEGWIKIKGGGTLRYRGLDRGTSVRSMNIGCLCIDEVIEFGEEEFEEMLYGLRNKNGSRQVYMATNPGAPDPQNFLYKKFFLSDDKDFEIITTSSYDNFYLPQDYFNMFKHMDPDRRRRMVEGLWVAIEGTVFNNFSRIKHVANLAKTDYEDFMLAIDWGQTHLAAFVLAGVSKGNISIVEEYAKSDLLIGQMKKRILDYKTKFPNLTIYYDPSAPILANELGNIGINLIKANNDKAVGIDRIRNRFGEGTIKIDSNCANLIREIENYTYEKNSDKPVKKGDDEIDCLRYIVNAVDDFSGSYIFPQFSFAEEEKKMDGEWVDVDQLQGFM
jgi:PBSX family phage terminase large subunit